LTQAKLDSVSIIMYTTIANFLLVQVPARRAFASRSSVSYDCTANQPEHKMSGKSVALSGGRLVEGNVEISREEKECLAAAVPHALMKYKRKVWARRGQNYTKDVPFELEQPTPGRVFVILVWVEGQNVMFAVHLKPAIVPALDLSTLSQHS
jgi:hypothetical protein